MESRLFGKKITIISIIIISAFLLTGSISINVYLKKNYPKAFSKSSISEPIKKATHQKQVLSNSEFEYFLKDNNNVCLTKYIGKEVDVLIPEKINENEVTCIEDNCFAYNNKIETITIPSTVTELRSLLFASCPNLIKVTFPPSITKIGDWIFAGSEMVIAYCQADSYSYNYCIENSIKVELY